MNKSKKWDCANTSILRWQAAKSSRSNPMSGIFEEALRRAGTSAPETMYVGDNYFADVVGSHRAGLRPVLYDPSGLFPDVECAIITIV